MITNNKSLLFLTTGIIFIVSFIALAGFLNNILSVWKIVWEILFLIIGALIIRAMVSNKAFLFSTVFYAVNLFIVVILSILGIGSQLFATLSILLLSAGFVFAVLNIMKKKKSLNDVHEEMHEAFDEIKMKPKLEVYEEKPKAVKKTVKKKAKKTVKKKAKKKKK